ncbi:MAG: hypothetical protein IJW76_05030 [Clostridia bacterium]|nr:hypothetical protein [Clostridia bacterium]MBQ8862318.1 hypothetical protein [Clostridia bacterium]
METTNTTVVTNDISTTKNTELVTTVGTDDALGNLQFRTDQIGESLGAMGKGMLGIFIVIAAIVLVSALLNKVTSTKKDGDEE